MNPKARNVFIWMMILMMALALSACDKKEKNAQKPVSGKTTEVSTPAPTATLAPTATTAPTVTPAPTAAAPTATPEPTQAPTPTTAPAPKATSTPKPTPTPVPASKGTSLLDIEQGELWYMAASYGDFSVEDNYSFGGKKFDKAVTVAFGTDSMFPSGEVFMVINNANKKYKSLALDAWVEEAPADGLGLFCVSSASELFEPLRELKELAAGQVKSFTVDISAAEEIWIYTGLNPGSKVGFANIVVK